LPAGAGRCPACLAIIKPPGFFQRLRDAFKGTIQVNVTHGGSETPEPGVHINFKSTVHTSYKILDHKTGQMKEYKSLEEVPAEFRAAIEQAQKQIGK
jgi:hypothetical protein